MLTSRTNNAIIGIILGVFLLICSLTFFVSTQGKVTVRAESNYYSGAENAFVRGKNFFAHGKIKSISYKEATASDESYTEVAPTAIGKYKVKIVVEKYLCKELQATIVDYEIKKVDIKLNVYQKYANSNLIKYNLTEADGLAKGDRLTLKIYIDEDDETLSTIKEIIPEGDVSHYQISKENISAQIGIIFHLKQIYYNDEAVQKPYHDAEFNTTSSPINTLPEPYVVVLFNEKEKQAFEEMKNSSKTTVEIIWCRSMDGTTQNHTIMGDDVSSYENGFRDYILVDPLKDNAQGFYSVGIVYYYDGYEALTTYAYFNVEYKTT